MDRNEAYRLLEVRPPFTERSLKSAFRAKILKAHPDQGGTAEKFQAVKSAFDLLLPDAGKEVEVDPVTRRIIDRTVDGVLIETLGKGLRVSATKCTPCKGNGYLTETRFSNCEACGGYQELGDLYTLLQNMSKRMGCQVCKGTGRGKLMPVRYWVCTQCEGTGEIAAFNPVFIKNSITVDELRRDMKQKLKNHADRMQDLGSRMRQQQAENYKAKQDLWSKMYDDLASRHHEKKK